MENSGNYDHPDEIVPQAPEFMLPGQCPERPAGDPPRVTAQLGDYYEEDTVRTLSPAPGFKDQDDVSESSEESSDSDSSLPPSPFYVDAPRVTAQEEDYDESSEESSDTDSSLSPSPFHSAPYNSPDLSYPGDTPTDMESPMNIIESPDSPTDVFLPGQIPDNIAQSPDSQTDVILPGQIPDNIAQMPPIYSRIYPGFAIPQEWFIPPEFPPLERADNNLLENWIRENREAYRGFDNSQAVVPYNPPNRMDSPEDDTITCTNTCTCTISSKTLRRASRAVRSLFRRIVRRIRGAFHRTPN
ncbi:uncharacterized protein [Engystomops pustulosus]|uniref:uncharacterized protein n=1 Tax=Engystomops pustulosus TaxID=76066 RepID=UPI003AFB0935